MITAPTLARSTDSSPPAELLALAPLHLPNHRLNRYAGDDVFVDASFLTADDQTLLRDLYGILNDLLEVIAAPGTTDAEKWAGVEEWTERVDLGSVARSARSLGVASHEQGASEMLAKAMHDVRGGALSALIGRLDLLEHTPRDENHLKVIFVLARDHLKIMRNAVVGLDEVRREADRAPKVHAISLMLDKWHESITGPKWKERPIRMTVDCRYEGGLTECCLESAAIDRIFYNLANNACRHAVGERLDMAIFPIPEAPGDCLRFVLSNAVRPEDATYLRRLRGGSVDKVSERGNLANLFEPQVSSTGSGFGLTVVADFVAGAFGLQDRTEALRGRYVGAILDGDVFRVWFHWPMARPTADQIHDDLPHRG